MSEEKYQTEQELESHELIGSFVEPDQVYLIHEFEEWNRCELVQWVIEISDLMHF